MLYSKNNYNLFYIENIFAIDNYCAKVLEVACQKKSKAKLDQVDELSQSCCNWKIPKVFPKKVCSV